MTLIIRRDMFFARDEVMTVNWRKRIHNNELDLLAGYMIKDTIDLEQIPTHEKCEAIINQVRQLLQDLHDVHMKKFIGSLPPDPAAAQQLPSEQNEALRKQIFGRGENIVEPIFYGNSGAYDFQYLWLVEDLYRLDQPWMQEHGIDLELYAIYCYALKAYVSIHASKTEQTSATAQESMEPLLIYPEKMQRFISKAHKGDARITKESLVTFLESFCSIPGRANGQYNGPGDRNDIEAFPIIKLGSDKYLLISEFNLAESIYNLPWIWMMHDKAYRKQAEKNRGQNIEALTHGLLERVFGDNSYHSVQVTKGSRTITDIDALVVVGNKAIAFQCKSKWLTDLSKSGDETSLEADFQKAIQEAYEQGLESRRILLDQTGYTFKLPDGTQIKPTEEIDEVYIMCITASFFPAAINMVDSYLKKSDGDPATISISLLDLDLMTHYLRDPYEFLYYVMQRIELSEVVKGTSEIALLGYHLNQRLHRLAPNTLEVADETFGQLIDADLLYRMGQADEPAQKDKLIPESNNPTYERVLNELKELEQPQITDAVMFFMDISGETATEIAKYIEQFMDEVSNGKRAMGDFSILFDKGLGGFTYVCGTNSKLIQNTIEVLAHKHKYEYRTDQWLGLGTVIDGSGRVVSMVWLDKERWVESGESEESIRLYEKLAARSRRTQRAAKRAANKRKRQKKRGKKRRRK